MPAGGGSGDAGRAGAEAAGAEAAGAGAPPPECAVRRGEDCLPHGPHSFRRGRRVVPTAVRTVVPTVVSTAAATTHRAGGDRASPARPAAP